jgi:hypothetical protein
MIDLSLAGLLGAVLGTIAAALVFGPLVRLVERGFRSRDASAGAEERRTFEREMSALRRGVLAADVLVLAGLGYWLGEAIGG